MKKTLAKLSILSSLILIISVIPVQAGVNTISLNNSTFDSNVLYWNETSYCSTPSTLEHETTDPYKGNGALKVVSCDEGGSTYRVYVYHDLVSASASQDYYIQTHVKLVNTTTVGFQFSFGWGGQNYWSPVLYSMGSSWANITHGPVTSPPTTTDVIVRLYFGSTASYTAYVDEVIISTTAITEETLFPLLIIGIFATSIIFLKNKKN
ncbi:MAG: hypothetical protein ACXAC7_15315 [Candidatus Hodarchaeales archaeon]|jgi:hypothetical protein